MDEDAAVDGNLVTSRTWRDLHVFMRMLIKMLERVVRNRKPVSMISPLSLFFSRAFLPDPLSYPTHPLEQKILLLQGGQM